MPSDSVAGHMFTFHYTPTGRSQVLRAGARLECCWRDSRCLALHVTGARGIYRCPSVFQQIRSRVCVFNSDLWVQTHMHDALLLPTSPSVTPLHTHLSGCLSGRTFPIIRNHPSMFTFLRVSVWRHRHGKLLKWTSSGPAVGSSTRKCTSHAHMGAQSQWAHTCTGGISACLCFEAAVPKLPVLLNPILKERFTPHVWEAPGVGTHATHIHKQNLHAWRNVQSLEQTDTFGYAAVCLLLLVEQYLSAVAAVYHTQQQEGSFYFGIVALLNYCFRIASFTFFSPRVFLLLLEELCMTAGAFTLKTHLNLRFWEKKDEDQRNRGMGG